MIFHRAQPVQVVETHNVEKEVKLTNNSNTTAETGTSSEIKPVLVNNDVTKKVGSSTLVEKPVVIVPPKLPKTGTLPKTEKPVTKTIVPAPVIPAAVPATIIAPTPTPPTITPSPLSSPTPAPETTPEQSLAISDLVVSTGDSTANFGWSTNIPAVGKIIYSESGGANTVVWSPTSLSTHHYANITKLNPGTTYNYTIEVVPTQSAKSASKTGSFTTTGSLIQGVKISNSPTGIGINWTTPVKSTCTFSYWKDSETPIIKNVQSDQSGLAHIGEGADGLLPNTEYHYSITATPNSGGTEQTLSGVTKTNPPLEITVTPSPQQIAVTSSTFADGTLCGAGCSRTLLQAIINTKYDSAMLIGLTVSIQGSENIATVSLLSGGNIGGATLSGANATFSGLQLMLQKDSSKDISLYFGFSGTPTGDKVVIPTITSVTVRGSDGVQTTFPVNVQGITLNY